MRGEIHQLNVKPSIPGERGLPKRPIESARLLADGVKGDFNRYRHERKSDDPGMALLLIPLETIRALNQEGWPIAPGDLGENVTSLGIAYNEFTPGLRFRIGGAKIEISKACDPCSTLRHLPYVGPEKVAAFVRTLAGRRGWYAGVLEEGVVRKGDSIEPVAD